MYRSHIIIEYIYSLRSTIRTGSIIIVEALQDKKHFAERHIAEVQKIKGTHVILEVYLFGKMTAESKLRRVNEITRLISSDDPANDQHLAQVWQSVQQQRAAFER